MVRVPVQHAIDGHNVAGLSPEIKHHPGPVLLQLPENLLDLFRQSILPIGQFGPFPGDELLDHLAERIRVDPVQGNVDDCCIMFMGLMIFIHFTGHAGT